MARYIPTDDMSRFLAREYVSTQLRTELGQNTLLVTVGEMAEDGTCPVYIQAPQAEFDFRTMLDVPQIDGTAWVEETSRRVEYDFPGTLQPYTFINEHTS